MTNTMMATVAALTFSAVANAGDLAYLGGVEYAVEAEAFEATAGVEYAAAGFTLTPVFTINYVSGDFDFDSAEITVGYDVATSVNVYATVGADADFEYTETTVGVALRF